MRLDPAGGARLDAGLSLEERTLFAEAIVTTIGLAEFAPVVVLCGMAAEPGGAAAAPALAEAPRRKPFEIHNACTDVAKPPSSTQTQRWLRAIRPKRRGIRDSGYRWRAREFSK